MNDNRSKNFTFRFREGEEADLRAINHISPANSEAERERKPICQKFVSPR